MRPLDALLETLLAKLLQHVVQSLSQLLRLSVTLLRYRSDDNRDKWTDVFRRFTHRTYTVRFWIDPGR